MNLGRKIANSHIIGRANSKTKKGLYIQIALADYFHNQQGDIMKDDMEKIRDQSNRAINELKKLLMVLDNPINILQANWGNVNPQIAPKINELLAIENKLHLVWDNIKDEVSDKIKDIINEIDHSVNKKI